MRNSQENQTRLIPAAHVRQELGGVSSITLWRWERDGLLPPARRLNGRKYWLRSEVDAVKDGASHTGSAA